MADLLPENLSRQQAAQFLGLSQKTLEADATRQHLGIPYVKAGRRVIYRKTDLDAWLESLPKKGGAA